MKRVLILGCGFGGLWAAQGLRKAPVEVTVLDRTNHHLFQPLLYQVATAGLSAPAIAAPIRHILRGQKNTTILLGDATAIDVAGKKVQLEDGDALAYDYLVVATGALAGPAAAHRPPKPQPRIRTRFIGEWTGTECELAAPRPQE